MTPKYQRKILAPFALIWPVNRRHRRALKACPTREICGATVAVITARENAYYLAHHERRTRHTARN